jgi:hypothetical protein
MYGFWCMIPFTKVIKVRRILFIYLVVSILTLIALVPSTRDDRLKNANLSPFLRIVEK